MNLETMTTKERWPRYVADEHPGVWVEKVDPDERGGARWASYRKPEESRHYPMCWHGWSIDIIYHDRGGFVVDCVRTLTDKYRTNFVLSRHVDTFEEAKKLALDWLDDPESVPSRFEDLEIEYLDDGPDSRGRRRFALSWTSYKSPYRPEPHPEDGEPVGHRRSQVFFGVPEDRLNLYRRQTLNGTLESLGLETQPATPKGAKDIIDSSTGEIVFTGRAWQVWEWLKETS